MVPHIPLSGLKISTRPSWFVGPAAMRVVLAALLIKLVAYVPAEHIEQDDKEA